MTLPLGYTPPPRADAALQLKPGANTPEAQRRTARDFEAQVLGAMLQPMFQALPTDGPFGGGAAEQQWRPMLVEEFGRAIARSGGLGIGDAVLREMQRIQSGTAPAEETP